MPKVHVKITYLRGRMLAAYVAFGHAGPGEIARSEEVGDGLVADYARDGRLLGVEIVQPQPARIADWRRVLERIRAPRVEDEDLAPLLRSA